MERPEIRDPLRQITQTIRREIPKAFSKPTMTPVDTMPNMTPVDRMPQ